MQATQTDVIERTVHIEAKPETVFAFLTDAERLSAWAGRSITIEPRPGGLFRLDYNGFDVMRGEFVEVVPHSKVVFTWGWESLGDQTRPGASTVTVTLQPEGDGTRLHLLHEGLSAMDLPAHGEGWDGFLSRLATRATGGDVEDYAPQLSAAEAYASRLNTLLVELRYILEGFPADKWTDSTSENRPVNALARHAVDHVSLVQVVLGIANGNPGPVAEITTDQLAARNLEGDRANAAVTRDAVLASLLSDGPKAIETIKALTDADLAASAAMAFAGGAQVPARAMIEGPLLTDIADHLAHIRAAS